MNDQLEAPVDQVESKTFFVEDFQTQNLVFQEIVVTCNVWYLIVVKCIVHFIPLFLDNISSCGHTHSKVLILPSVFKSLKHDLILVTYWWALLLSITKTGRTKEVFPSNTEEVINVSMHDFCILLTNWRTSFRWLRLEISLFYLQWQCASVQAPNCFPCNPLILCSTIKFFF